MGWLISPPEETPWRMDRSEVVELLRRLWPNVEIIPADPQTKMALRWEMNSNANDWITGSLEDIGQCLYVDGMSMEIARLAFHAKQEFAPIQDLILFDGSYEVVIPLEGMSKEDIRCSLDGNPEST